MNEKTRNSIVGLTVLIALGLVTWGAFLLGRLPTIGPGAPYLVTVESPSADGLVYGDSVSLNGVNVGTVRSVALGKNMQGAILVLGISSVYHLPMNTTVRIASKTIGSPYVSLFVPPGAPTKYLPTDGTANLHASVASGSLIPHSFASDFTAIRLQFSVLSTKLDRVADDLHSLLRPASLTGPDKPGDRQGDLGNISALIQRLNKTVESVNGLLTDKKLQGQVREIVTNAAVSAKELAATLKRLNSTVTRFNSVMDKAGTTAADIDTVAKTANSRLISVSLHIAQVLEHLNTITTSIAQGHGTAGHLVKDPRLYNSLLDLTHRLKKTVDSLHALVKQIKAEGFAVHVGV